MAELLLDLVLAAGLVAMAWAALGLRDVQGGIVMFIAFGLLMALAWARLEAPDVALAEAAIGAGVTGGLLLEGLSRMRGTERAERGLGGAPGALAAALAGLAALAIAAALVSLPDEPRHLATAVDATLDEAGAENPVTAVLLNLRAYDTWLEIAVLLLAAAAMLALVGGSLPRGERGRPGEVLEGFTQAAVPVMVVVGAYLLWRGTSGPGGAFQAGSVLAAGGILLYVTRLAPSLVTFAFRSRSVLVGGLMAFALLAIAAVLWGRSFLAYPDQGVTTLIVTIEVAVTLAIAATLSGALACVTRAGERGARE